MGWPFYEKEKHFDKVKLPFNGIDKLQRNRSQAFQDMFVLSMLDGKTNGFYVEIGAFEPININNSYVLESFFNWNGVAFEISKTLAEKYNKVRKNKVICQNALTVDYSSLFEQLGVSRIDYLSLDIEPLEQTLSCLKSLPLDDYRFSVITYETDLYRGPAGLESRSILESHGYQLVCKNIANREGVPFEDWWVDPQVVPEERWSKLFSDTECTLAKDAYLK